MRDPSRYGRHRRRSLSSTRRRAVTMLAAAHVLPLQRSSRRLCASPSEKDVADAVAYRVGLAVIRIRSRIASSGRSSAWPTGN
jgi:hypothetical protein